MHTQIVKLDPERFDPSAVRPAAEAVRKGGIVIFPTETVYGMGVDRDNTDAVRRLLEVRESPAEKLLTVHIAAAEDVKKHYPGSISGPARRLMKKFWPGPMTLVLGTKDGVGMGFRCPNHKVALELIRQAKVTLVAPSVNKSGKPPAVTGEDAARDFSGQVEFILDAGPTKHRTSSTVVRVTDFKVDVLREGAIPKDMIAEASVVSVLFVCTGNTCRSPIAEFLFRKMMAKRYGTSEPDLEKRGFRISSAGTSAGVGAEAFDESMQAARKVGLNLESHRSKPVTMTLIDESDIIYVMTETHRESILEWVPEAKDKVMFLDPTGEEIADPVGGSEETYRKCIAQIRTCLEQRIKEF